MLEPQSTIRSWFGEDRRTIIAVSSAHFASHFLALSLAPLLPLIHAELEISYTQLGLIVTIFYLTSGVGQIIAGALVDRWQGHRLLLAGLALQSVAMAAMAFASNNVAFAALALLAGIGNSVYHPANLSILSGKVSEGRLGRAFATHSIGGIAGFAVAPVVMGIVATFLGWQVALLSAGLIGMLIWAALISCQSALVPVDAAVAAGRTTPSRSGGSVLAMAGKSGARQLILGGFALFLLLAVAEQAIQTFGVAVLTEGYGATLLLATFSVAAFQLGRIAGILTSGAAADKTGQHLQVVLVGLAVSSGVTITLGMLTLPPGLIAAFLAFVGFATGLIVPSRDILVRNSVPQSGRGKAFGFVYSGLDAGSLLTPLMYGALLDLNMPYLVFVTGGAALAVACVITHLTYRGGASGRSM